MDLSYSMPYLKMATQAMLQGELKHLLSKNQ